MVVLLVGGFYTVLTIKKEIQPRIETNYISVEVPFLGATPLDVEEGVVVKIEEAIQDVQGITEINVAETLKDVRRALLDAVQPAQ